MYGRIGINYWPYNKKYIVRERVFFLSQIGITEDHIAHRKSILLVHISRITDVI